MTADIQRPLRGSRISTFYPVKTLPALASLDSAFQLQEFISLLIRLDPHDVERIVSIPEKPSGKESNSGTVPQEEEVRTEEKEGKGEITVDEACWIYEQLRRLAQDLTHPLITMLQQECTRASCPEMKAGEWLYLCVAHGNDGAMEQCCAIDYILHTLDSATALLNSPRAFPSRLSIPQTSTRHFSALARRLGRIFAHAYFHHREAFEQAEAESSLYARFLVLTRKFDLVPEEFLVIPSTAGLDRDREVEPPRLLGASLDPEKERQRGDHKVEERDVALPGAGEGAMSPLSPARNESPRKMGRNRTDTMVFSEVINLAEELAKGDNEGETEREHAGGVLGASRTMASIIGSTSPFALRPVRTPSPQDITAGLEDSSIVDPIIVPETDIPSTSTSFPNDLVPETKPEQESEPDSDQHVPASEPYIMLAPPAEMGMLSPSDLETPKQEEGTQQTDIDEGVKDAEEKQNEPESLPMVVPTPDEITVEDTPIAETESTVEPKDEAPAEVAPSDTADNNRSGEDPIEEKVPMPELDFEEQPEAPAADGETSDEAASDLAETQIEHVVEASVPDSQP